MTIASATGAFLIFFKLELGYAIQSQKCLPVLANITDYAFIEEVDDEQQPLIKSVFIVWLKRIPSAVDGSSDGIQNILLV